MSKHPLQLAIEESGEFQCRSYSGRAMYGHTCLAVTIDHNLGDLLGDIIDQVDDDNRDEINAAIRNFRSDSLGLNEIVYFPGVPYSEADEEADEEDECAEECGGCGAGVGVSCSETCPGV